MTAPEAALLGLVQGLTEFLPVSSTAHLLVLQEWLGVNEPGLRLEVAVHLGTVAAVLVHYRRLFASITRDAVLGGPERRLALQVVLATLLLGLVGVVHLAAPSVKAWRDDVRVVPFGLVGVGLFMLATAFVRRGSDPPTTRAAVGMGLAQCVAAIVPGCSRSGSTIGTGVLAGTDPREAARFSFLMSVPAVLAGTLKDVVDEGLPPGGDAAHLLVAGTVAFASGLAAIHVMLTLVGRGRLHWFAPYCIALGIVVALL